MNITSLLLPWATLAAYDDTPVFYPRGVWRSVGAINDARARWEIAAILAGPIEIIPAVEVANTEDVPGADTALGSYQSTVDVFWPTTWTTLSSAFAGVQIFRPGFLVKRSSGSGLVMATAGGSIDFRSC